MIECTFAFLCKYAEASDEASLTSAIGIGVHDIAAEQVPAALPSLYFVVYGAGDVDDVGARSLELIFEDQDGTEVWSAPGTVDVWSPAADAVSRFRLITMLPSLPVSRYGWYAIQCLVDGKTLCRVSLQVVRPGQGGT